MNWPWKRSGDDVSDAEHEGAMKLEVVTRAFGRVVEESTVTPAEWGVWHLAQLRDLAEDDAARASIERKLRGDPALLEEVQGALDLIGDLVATAALGRQTAPGSLALAFPATWDRADGRDG
jgi:hypothetical protein